jgi:hypothetical protein
MIHFNPNFKIALPEKIISEIFHTFPCIVHVFASLPIALHHRSNALKHAVITSGRYTL